MINDKVFHDNVPPLILHFNLPFTELTPYNEPSSVETNRRCS